MEPRPTQKPCPPVWMGGYTEKAHARLGRLADGWISYFYTPEAFATNWRRILDATESAGRDAFGMANCNMIPARLDNDRDHAALTLKQFVTKYCDLPAWSQATVESGLSGPSRDVVGGIEAQRAAGVQEVVLVPAVTSLAEIREQIEAMGRDVLPSFV